MFSLAVLGGIWALIGIPMVVRGVHDRRELPMEEFQRAMGALQSSHDGRPLNGYRTTARRRTVAILMYVPGTVLAALGAALQDVGVLTAAVALVNLGTVHRLLTVMVDRSSRPQRGPTAAATPYRLPPAPSGAEPLPAALEPGVDEGAGDGKTWGDGWQVIGPEPRGVRDLVLVDADVS